MILNVIPKIDYTKSINVVAIFYAFVLPLSRAGIGIFTGILILLWLLDGRFKEKWNAYKNSQVLIIFLAFLIFSFLSLLWTDDIVNALDIQRRYWYFLPVFVLMFYLKNETIPKILSAFIIGMFVSEAISYGVFFELWQFKHATPANPSPFMHHIEYSVFLAFTSLLVLERVFNEKVLKYKIVYGFFFVTVTGNLFLTAGRTGQLAFIIGIFVLVMSSFQHKLKAFLLSISIGSIVVGMAFILSTTFHDRIMTGKNNLVSVIEDEDYCTSWGSRVGAWIISKEIIEEHPFIGMGVSDTMKEFHKIIDEKYPSMRCMHKSFMHIHNQYLQILTQFGLIGLFLFLGIFYKIWRLEFYSDEWRHIRNIYLAVILFSFIPEVLLGRQFNIALFALIVGLLLAKHRIEHEFNSH